MIVIPREDIKRFVAFEHARDHKVGRPLQDSLRERYVLHACDLEPTIEEGARFCTVVCVMPLHKLRLLFAVVAACEECDLARKPPKTRVTKPIQCSYVGEQVTGMTCLLALLAGGFVDLIAIARVSGIR